MPRNLFIMEQNLLTDNKITLAMVAKWFNYSNPNSFYGSKAKKDVIKGVIQVIKHLQQQK